MDVGCITVYNLNTPPWLAAYIIYKIEFYTQEMGREINTIGAKSVNQSISHKVIKLKDELEKIKEQARNIE